MPMQWLSPGRLLLLLWRQCIARCMLLLLLWWLRLLLPLLPLLLAGL